MRLLMKYYDFGVFFIIKLLTKVGIKNKITFLRKYSLESSTPELFNPKFKINAKKSDLTNLANHYRTDKGDIKHGYTYIYEQYLYQFRDSKFNMLEIGVANGSSIQMWKDYFPNASITGLDIEESCSTLFYNEPRVEIFIGDSNSYNFNDKSFQIILDDG